MAALIAAVVCFAYIVGLLSTALTWTIQGLPGGAIALLLLGVVAFFVMPRLWRTGVRSWVWLAAGLVGFLAVLYFQMRLPQPGAQDVSFQVADSASTVAEIRGQILSSPRLTQSQRIQFWLEAKTVRQIAAEQATNTSQASTPQTVTGKVYATVPLLQGTGLYPGETVSIKGSLYKPRPAMNPGGFDFQAYLAQQGGFAGLNGWQVQVEAGRSPPLLWQIQQRIVRSQVQGLGVPEGPLVSAMVMGRNGVDLPFDLRDQFAKSGLAHALAASGFQVSLLVGVILALTRQLPPKLRLCLGIGVIVGYIALTGIQPSVLRAGIMGLAALFAMSAERKVKPLGSLLLAATALLIYNPGWIWDLGFQFSFLATLGLLVTVPTLTQWLDWMPTAIAPLIAVPIAAYLWTLPLQLYVFGVVSPYCIPINIVVAPLITLISVGGMVSALAALVYLPAGSALASLLYYPVHGLIRVTEFNNQLPGSFFAVGTIAALQVVVLYGLFALIWWRWQRFWWIAFAMGTAFVVVPAWYIHANLLQATVLDASGSPVLIVQSHGRTTVVNSGDEEDANFTVLPFLRQQGINQIDWAIATDPQISGWYRLLKSLPIDTFYSNSAANSTATPSQGSAPAISQPIDQLFLTQLQARQGQYLPLTTDQPLQADALSAQVLSVAPAVLQFRIGDRHWLMLNHIKAADQQKLIVDRLLPTAEVLWWTGEELDPQLLEHIQPKVAIASARSLPPIAQAWLQQHAVSTYAIEQDSALQWTPHQGFVTTLSASNNQ
jgi:competence protein ComEC